MERLEMEGMVRALAARVEALESENARLRAPVERAPVDPVASGTSRRHLLSGGAGLLAVLAGGGLVERTGVVSASEAGSYVSQAAGVVRSTQFVQPRVVGLQATLAPQYSHGRHWARYEWDLSAHFTAAQPPVVVASALDDYHGVDAAAAPACAVAVQREQGGYRAVILVGNVGHLASQVTLNALAFGE